ncbi:unnamed protein product [Urochloa decumbens]|uniref:F-box domain-containing protein n=1 Tax=Urochloa decumbens TaxID=240449 RepID=A0ABC9A2S9_9POAL
MAIPIPGGVCWPRPSCRLGADDATARRHGLDPDLLDPRKEKVLGFLYTFLPAPPVSAAATLSCAAAPESEDGEGGADRISALPDDLLRHVLARLPAKDGARTAVLSTRWRGLWHTAPLVLVDAHFLPLGAARPPRPGAALAAHPGPIPFVSLTCGFYDDADADRAALERLFTLLATKGVDELVFVNRPWPLPGLRLPAALFGCASLRRLHLGAWVLPDWAKLPRGPSFPNLQELVLGAVVMDNLDLLFVALCLPRARCCSQSLRSVQFCLSMVEEVAAVNAPCLERLFIWRCWSHHGRRIKIGLGHAPRLDMLGYLEPGVHELEIGNTIIKSGTKPSPRTTVPAVRTLALSLNFAVYSEVKMLPSFLKCFPNVETLCVESEVTHEDEPIGTLDLKFWQESGPIECVQWHLKTLVLREFHGEQNEFDFLMYVAENARVLENMVLVLKIGRYSAPEEVACKFMALDSARWASGGSKLKSLLSRLRDGGSLWSLKAGCDLSFGDPFFCL